jgi:hypothetical protein
MSRSGRGVARAVALGAAISGVAVAGAAFAIPAKGPTLEITVIHAAHSDAGASIDPALRDLPQLTHDEPFVRYNVYKMIERAEQPLETGKPDTYGIVNGRTLQLTLVDVTTTAGPHPERRFHVRAAIGEPGKQDFLKLLEVTAGEGQPFFVGGQSYQGGTLFLELVIR